MMHERLVKGQTRDAKWFALVMKWLDNYDDMGTLVVPIDGDRWFTLDVDIDDTQKDGETLLKILANCEGYTVYTTNKHVHYHITFETFDVYLMYRQI